jgi:hypothetical protein
MDYVLLGHLMSVLLEKGQDNGRSKECNAFCLVVRGEVLEQRVVVSLEKTCP